MIHFYPALIPAPGAHDVFPQEVDATLFSQVLSGPRKRVTKFAS